MAIEYSIIPSPSKVNLVTQTSNGIMSSTDKVKLDGIEWGATAYPIIVTGTVAPDSVAEIVRITLSTVKSVTYIVDLDDSTGGVHFRIDAKKVGLEVDYVTYAELGELDHTAIDVYEGNGDIVFDVANTHLSETVTVTLKII